jgi:pilus assembly protein CpaC
MNTRRAGLLCLGLLLSSPGWLAGQSSEDMRLTAGKSIVIDYASDIGRISTSNADVVDAVAVSAREVLLHAKAQGTSTVIIWPRQGARSVYNILVEQDLEPARRLLKETFPQESIEIQAAKDSLSLTGVVSSQGTAERAAALMIPFAKAVVNNLKILSSGPEKQVLLRVKFAELNRAASNSFGVNLISTGATNTIGSTTTGQFAPARPTELKGVIGAGAMGAESKFTISDALNVFAFRPDLNLAAFVRALQSQSLLQILAEPNLVTTNGKDASFLVGGEFPVPVIQGGAAVGSVTILFKEFGIRLTFKPEITEHDTIRMYVKPEVSTIDVANSVSLGGFTIPALATRRMETNIELGQGQSFVIGGLIDDRVTETLSKVPGLAHIPILGVLFKSRLENRAKTELIVMVTPEITTPVNTADLKPLPHMKESLQNFLLAPNGTSPAASRPAPATAPRKRGNRK